MRAHRNDVYRARRSRGKAWPVILWILAGLIVLAVILFYAGQNPHEHVRHQGLP